MLHFDFDATKKSCIAQKTFLVLLYVLKETRENHQQEVWSRVSPSWNRWPFDFPFLIWVFQQCYQRVKGYGKVKRGQWESFSNGSLSSNDFHKLRARSCEAPTSTLVLHCTCCFQDKATWLWIWWAPKRLYHRIFQVSSEHDLRTLIFYHGWISS